MRNLAIAIFIAAGLAVAGCRKHRHDHHHDKTVVKKKVTVEGERKTVTVEKTVVK